MSNMSPTRRFVLNGLLATLSLLGFAACSRTPAETATVRPVKAIVLESSGHTRTLTLPGVAQAVRETDLAFRVGGPLVAFDVVTGQRVQEGNTVARIDSRDFKVRVATLEANLASSRASLEEATLRYHRYETLLREGAAAQAVFDQAKAGYKMATARVEADTRNLEDARNALADVILRAPFDGFIDREFAEIHETVSPGQPVISITDLSVMEVEISLPADLLAEVPNMNDFECSFAAVPARHFTAILKEVGNQPNPSRQTYPLTVTLEGEAAAVVRPGMAAEVAITLHAARTHRFVLPVEALVKDNSSTPFVWVVSPSDHRVQKRSIHPVELSPAGVEVEGDLRPGEWVITAGVHQLQDDQQVRILEPVSDTNIGGEL